MFNKSSKMLLKLGVVGAVSTALVVGGSVATASAVDPAPPTGTTLRVSLFTVPQPVDTTRRPTVQGVVNLRSTLDPAAVHLRLTCDDGQLFDTPLQGTSSPTILRFAVELPLTEVGHRCLVDGYVSNEAHPLVFNPVTMVNNPGETEVWVSGIDNVVYNRLGGL
ncbi:hypothetical protein [Subtercola boreus]|nr:hypothetical protein [Subtercola boreus]TQL54097.1 hypothetical protein FB464_1627 [Subtercola boreus]